MATVERESMVVRPSFYMWYEAGETRPWRCDLYYRDGGMMHLGFDTYLEQMKAVSDFWAREMPEPVEGA